jgi:tetratricopeptide (TPR) repeat protein
MMADGHWLRARAAAEASYKASPGDGRANYWLGRVRHEFAQLDEAQKLLETAVKLDPSKAAYHRELGELYCDQAQKVSVFKQLGLAHKCRDQMDAALALSRDADNLGSRMSYYLEAPAIAGGDKQKATELAAEILKIDPARGYLAQARIARAQNGNPEPLYYKAAEADPRNYAAQITLAVLAVDAKHDDPAMCEKHSRAAIALNPDRAEGYRWLALALARQGRVEEVAKTIALAQAAIPDDLSPLVFAARGFMSKNIELARAEQMLRRYLAETREPEHGAPLLAGARWSLALALEKQGNKKEAVGELEAALRLKPDFEPAKRDLKRLK